MFRARRISRAQTVDLEQAPCARAEVRANTRPGLTRFRSGRSGAERLGNILAAVKRVPIQEPLPAWTDTELVEACLRGSEEAWCAVVAKYKNLVYSAPVRYNMSPDDAADIFQEVWVDLYLDLKNLRKPGALAGWLRSVALHKCYQWKLRRWREAEPRNAGIDREPVAPEPLFPDWKEGAERAQVLHEAIQSLPERYQTMVHLLFYQDPPVAYAEVARRLGLSEGSIGFIRGRCLQKLRASLERRGY